MKIDKRVNNGGHKTAGRKKKADKMVNDTIKLPLEVKQGLNAKQKREAILTAFQAKIK
jgi:hypothetical protein